MKGNTSDIQAKQDYKRAFFYAVNISKWESMVTDSLSVTASSGNQKKCNPWQLHNGFMFQPWRLMLGWTCVTGVLFPTNGNVTYCIFNLCLLYFSHSNKHVRAFMYPFSVIAQMS